MPVIRWSSAIVIAVIAGAAAFQFLHLPVLSSIGLPHEVCYVQQPKLIWLHVISDLLIGVAYVCISSTLAYLVYRASKDIPFHWVFLAFGLFIVSCGFTHFMEVIVVWHPLYWLSGYIKVITAASSVATAVVLFPLVPKIFRLIDNAREGEQRRLEIERLNAELERFNYSVAHDLRAPLRSIAGFGQILQEDHGSQLSGDARQYVERMQRAAQRMDVLVTSLLHYATVGRQAMTPLPVPLAQPIHAAIAALDHDIKRSGAVIDVPESLPTVIGDETLLEIVAQNLIGNSLKFVAPGVTPHVRISARTDEAYVYLTFADNGVGFPPQARAKIFAIFERFHPDHPGTGIGLAVVHRAVERMHGSITVSEGPDGVGTEFHLRLPGA